MAVMFTSGLKNNLMQKENQEQEVMCQESKKCIEILELLLDGEATAEQEGFFKSHIEKCMPCYRYYDLEKSIKEILQTKVERKAVPRDLVDSIKSKIRETV